MKKEKQPLKIKDILENATLIAKRFSRYKVVVFVVVIALIYGFVVLKIESFNNATPSSDQISSQTSQTATAHVDKTVVTQLETLRDNSVGVQALFAQQRSNPFQD